LEVISFVDEDKKKIVFTKEIKGKKQFNSWFFSKFDEGICLIKGTKCSIRAVLPQGVKADYQNITWGQISSIDEVEEDSEDSLESTTFKIFNYVVEGDKLERKCADDSSTACIIKSLHFTRF